MNKDLHNQGPGPDFDEYLHSTEPLIRVPEDLDRQVRQDLQRRLQRRHRRRPNWLMASAIAAIGLLAVVGFEVIVGASGFTLRNVVETECYEKSAEYRDYDLCQEVVRTESGDDWLVVPKVLEGEDPAVVIPQVQRAYEQFMSGEGRIVEASGWQLGEVLWFSMTTEVDYPHGPQEYSQGTGYPDDIALMFKCAKFIDDNIEALRERIERGEVTCIGEETRVVLEHEFTFRKYSVDYAEWGEVIFYEGQLQP